jgi:hypothetical protein
MTGLVFEKGEGEKAGFARLFPFPPPTKHCVNPNEVRNPKIIIIKLINNHI